MHGSFQIRTVSCSDVHEESIRHTYRFLHAFRIRLAHELNSFKAVSTSSPMDQFQYRSTGQRLSLHPMFAPDILACSRARLSKGALMESGLWKGRRKVVN